MGSDTKHPIIQLPTDHDAGTSCREFVLFGDAQLMTDRSTLFKRIESAALFAGLGAAIISFVTGDLKIVGGVFTGAAIGWINVSAIRSLISRGLSGMESAPPSHPAALGRAVRGEVKKDDSEDTGIAARRTAILAGFGVKFVVLVIIITVSVLTIGVHPTGLLVGFSVSVAAVLIVPLLNPLFEGKDGAGTTRR